MSDSFVHGVALKTTPHDLAVLDTRLDAARQPCNARLRESLKRLDLMRASKPYQTAKALPKGKVRNAAFQSARDHYQFQEYGMHAFAVKTQKCLLGLATTWT